MQSSIQNDSFNNNIITNHQETTRILVCLRKSNINTTQPRVSPKAGQKGEERGDITWSETELRSAAIPEGERPTSNGRQESEFAKEDWTRTKLLRRW